MQKGQEKYCINKTEFHAKYRTKCVKSNVHTFFSNQIKQKGVLSHLVEQDFFAPVSHKGQFR